MQQRLEGKAGGILIETLAELLVLIPLSKGGKHGDGTQRYTLIDEADYPLVRDFTWQARWSWTNHAFYASTTIRVGAKRRTERLHRLLFSLTPGRDVQVDHRNQVTLDNRRRNLRLATPSQSGCNRSLRSDNPTGFKGVGVDRGSYRARIRLNGHLHSLGYFSTPEQAAAAYDHAAHQLHGEFARTNA